MCVLLIYVYTPMGISPPPPPPAARRCFYRLIPREEDALEELSTMFKVVGDTIKSTVSNEGANLQMSARQAIYSTSMRTYQLCANGAPPKSRWYACVVVLWIRSAGLESAYT